MFLVSCVQVAWTGRAARGEQRTVTSEAGWWSDARAWQWAVAPLTPEMGL